jgi:heptosyltransferase-2
MKLIIRVPNWVGDAVMALSAVDNARDITGASRIAVMARGRVAPIYRHHPDVDQIITIDNHTSGLRSIRRAARQIRDERYDIGVILSPSFSSALIFRLGKVRGRVGYKGDGRSFLLTKALPAPEEKMHRAEQYVNLLRRVTGKMLPFRPPRLYLSHEELKEAELLLKAHGVSFDDPYIVIGAQAVAESRRWGSSNYATVAKKLVDNPGYKVVVIGSNSDFDTGEQIGAGSAAKVINLCGKTDLLIAAAIQSFARLYIGDESGLAHLAASVNTPVLVLAGAADPTETAPLADIRTIIIKSDLPCISCVKNVCPKRGDGYKLCMKMISPEEVTDAARRMLST